MPPLCCDALYYVRLQEIRHDPLTSAGKLSWLPSSCTCTQQYKSDEQTCNDYVVGVIDMFIPVTVAAAESLRQALWLIHVAHMSDLLFANEFQCDFCLQQTVRHCCSKTMTSQIPSVIKAIDDAKVIINDDVVHVLTN